MRKIRFEWHHWQLCLIPLICTSGLGAAQLDANKPDAWQRTIDKVTPAVVTIKVDHPRAFDENWNQSTHASGFVVDAERGIILTNRHVVGPGPATAQAIFHTKEEVVLTPLYRDPVHDFGFFQYDPSDLQFAQPKALQLVPEGADIGVNIRIIGNDAGEQLAILDGTIARLDRDAPNYGHGKYNDFNTFYIQASSGSSGGSSGSPVINDQGQVVALNAGSKTAAATSFFLPLTQTVKALGHLRRNEQIPRGTLRTTFTASTFPELNKLGLADKTEQSFRQQFPSSQSMLVVDQVLPESAATEHFRVGDVLTTIDDRLVANFDILSDLLDSNVHKTLRVCVERAGTTHCQHLTIEDLHTITPTDYIEFDGAVLHNLSYHRARHLNRDLKGVYLADPGFGFAQSGVPKGSVIIQMHNQPITDLDDFEAVLANTYQGQDVSLRYVALKTNRTEKFATLQLGFNWFPSNRCETQHAAGVWRCRQISAGGHPTALAQTTNQEAIESAQSELGQATKLINSLVHIRFNTPFALSGAPAGKRTGTGIIVDRVKGRILASRTLISSTVGDAFITFAGQREIPAQVTHLHPAHNFALLQYDPKLVANLPITQAKLATHNFVTGRAYDIVGLDSKHKVRQQSVTLAEMEPVQFPTSAPPRFQNSNTELLQFISAPTDFTGVIIDDTHQVIALWQKFEHQSNGRTRTWHRGTQTVLAQQFLHAADNQRDWRELGAQWFPTTLAQAYKRGLPQKWLRTQKIDPAQLKLYELFRLTQGTSAQRQLQSGDILLKLNGQLVTSLIDIDLQSQSETVDVSILRDATIKHLELTTSARSIEDIDHIVAWSGALIQPPPLALARERQIPLSGVYVSFYRYGSPASRSQLVANLRIVEIDEDPINNMADFVDAVDEVEHGATVRIRALDLNNQPHLLTLRTDNNYWPTYELRRGSDGWQRRLVN